MMWICRILPNTRVDGDFRGSCWSHRPGFTERLTLHIALDAKRKVKPFVKVVFRYGSVRGWRVTGIPTATLAY